MPPSKVGIDTIRLSVPIGEDHRMDSWSERCRADKATGTVSSQVSAGSFRLGSGVRVHVRRRGSGLRAEIEQSIPRYFRQHNATTSDLREVERFAADVHEDLAGFCDVLVEPHEMPVARVDGVRDFLGVPQVPTFLSNLSRIPPARRGVTGVYLNDNGVGTAKRYMPGRWSALAYDKHAQTLALARTTRDPTTRDVLTRVAASTLGQVRFEAQLHRPVLRENGIRTMSDLTPEAVEGLTRTHFTLGGFDMPVHPGGHLNALLLTKALEGTPAKKIGGVLAYLASEALGFPWVGDDRPRRDYRALAAEWDVSPADWSAEQGGRASLDFDRGALA